MHTLDFGQRRIGAVVGRPATKSAELLNVGSDGSGRAVLVEREVGPKAPNIKALSRYEDPLRRMGMMGCGSDLRTSEAPTVSSSWLLTPPDCGALERTPAFPRKSWVYPLGLWTVGGSAEMTRWWRPSAVVAVTALGVSLSSCGASGGRSASQSSTGSELSTSSQSTNDTGAISPASPSAPATKHSGGGIPTNVPDQARVRPDVNLINCGQTKGGWSAGGTVQNSLRRRATYIITVFFTSAQATDLASAVTSVPLAAGQSKLWSTQATFAAPGQVLCVLHGVAAR